MDTDLGPHSAPAACGPDAPAFDIVPATRPDCPLLLVCDHATNHIPDSYGRLGLEAWELERHIAYDIGAGVVTRALAAHFGATAILSRFSRLLIDPNRGEDDPTLIMRISDGAVVPGNRQLDKAERLRRLNRYYLPYHRAVTHALDDILARGLTPVLISVHSFTESWKGVPRSMQIGILWDVDGRVAQPLMRALGQDSSVTVGNNEPYSGELTGDSMWRHGTERGIPHALVEVRQDLIRDTAGQRAWSARLARALETTLAEMQTTTAPAPNGSVQR